MSDEFLFSAFLVGWLSVAVRLAGPLLLAALGELFGQRAGVVNIGLEGTMLLGAITSYVVALQTGSPVIGTLAAVVIGLALGLCLAWMYVTARADQIVCGLIFNLLAFGIASYGYQIFVQGMTGPQKIEMFAPFALPGLSRIPLLGEILFTHAAPLYLTVILAGIAWIVLFRTRFGLRLRAAGEDPRAAAAAGINVVWIRYVGVLISCVGGAAAGAYLVLAQIGLFRETIIAGQGFIALAIVIFGRWNPWNAVLAALAFGAADALQLSLQLFEIGWPPQIFLALPYLVTVIAMSGLLGKVRQPEALMKTYRRE